VEGGRLLFENRGEKAGLAPVEGYEYEWFSFDNARTASLGGAARAPSPSIPLPPSEAEFLMARLHTLSSNQPAWKKAVDVYVRVATRQVVGIEREE
jgi:hypothetical protein